MRVRMKIQMSGTRNGAPWPDLGEPTDIPTGEAQHLVAAGIAEVVDDVPEVETAAAPSDAAETATPAVKRGRGRPRKE